MKTVIRKDENTIEVTKDGWDTINEQIIEVTNEFKLDFLTTQKQTIQDQKDREIAQRDSEMATVDTLLSYFDEYPYSEQVINESTTIDTTAQIVDTTTESTNMDSVTTDTPTDTTSTSIGMKIWNGLTNLFS